MSQAIDAQKFIVRFTGCDELHQQAKEAAKENHIPLNSFILQAIEEKLKRKDRLERLLGMTEKAAKKSLT